MRDKIKLAVGALILIGCGFLIKALIDQNDPTILKRGDRVRIVDCQEDDCFYRSCEKVTYLDGIALDRVNAVWLLVEGCNWYQYPDIGLVTTRAVTTMRRQDIVKYDKK